MRCARLFVIGATLLSALLSGCDEPASDAVINRRLIPELVQQRITAGRLAHQDAWPLLLTD
jgi:hypothetical protein